LASQRLAAAQKERRNRIIFVSAGVVVLIIVIAVAVWGVMSAMTKGGNQTPPNATSGKDGIWLTHDNPDAPTLQVYSDYNCPNCKTAELTLHQAMDDLAAAGAINISTHALAFEAASSREAANAAACADAAGVFADYNYQLFLNQPSDGTGLTKTMMRETIPATISLTGDKLTEFQTCYDESAMGKFVDAEIKYAADQKVTTTPSFILDGKNITSEIYNTKTRSYDPDLLRSVVNG
jgi:protein-disulfide isomerase